MKNKRKFISLILVLTLCVTAFTDVNVDAKGKVKLNKKKITLTVGAKYKLKLKNYKKKIRWKSSNKKVASISKKGVVTAKKKGNATIKAIVGKKKYTCKVTVKNVRQTSDGNLVDISSAAPISTSTTPKNTITMLPIITPSSTPVATPTVTPSSTPVATPTVTPSSTPVATPIVTPSSTPIATPIITPTTMQDIPKFIGFKTYDDKELITTNSEKNTYAPNGMFALESPQVETAITDTEDVASNLINKREMLLVKLSYKNKKRDNIVEVVLNDSDYGKNQIYTTSASINKILSSDTYYDEESDSYITDILLQMPATKNESKRTIEITETCFLRETLGIKGYADLSSSRQTTVTFFVSEEPLPSYSLYFNFLENDKGGYTVTSWNQKYSLPSTLYIPPTYNGKPVNKIGSEAFDKATMNTLIIPETVKEIGDNFLVNTFPTMKELIMKGNIPQVDNLGFSSTEMKGKFKIIVPLQYALNYKYCKGSPWAYISDLIYCFFDGKYILIGDIDIPVPLLKNSKISIVTSNEATATLNKTVYRTNVTWDSVNKTISFTSMGLDDWASNGGISFNLDSINKSFTDVSAYNYVKIEVDSDVEIGIKLLQNTSSIWSMTNYGYFEKNNSSISECTGHRTIYFDISEENPRIISSILVFANKVNTPVKIYSIEFVTEKTEE